MIPSQAGYIYYQVDNQNFRTRHRSGRFSWEDQVDPTPGPYVDEPFLRKVQAFRQRMWVGQSGRSMRIASCSAWLLNLLRRELGHDFFDHDRLRLVLQIVHGWLTFDE